MAVMLALVMCFSTVTAFAEETDTEANVEEYAEAIFEETEDLEAPTPVSEEEYYEPELPQEEPVYVEEPVVEEEPVTEEEPPVEEEPAAYEDTVDSVEEVTEEELNPMFPVQPEMTPDTNVEDNSSVDLEDNSNVETSEEETIKEATPEEETILEENEIEPLYDTYNGTGIYGNDTWGLTIDIASQPYTYFKSKPYGQYAYGPDGCAWFAAARVYELTGEDCVISSGSSWYNERYSLYGFTRGQNFPTTGKALACYSGHVSVIEAIGGDSVLVSEGGNTLYPKNNYCSITIKTKDEVKSGGFLGFVYFGVVNDGKAPEIKNAHITNATTTSYEVRFNVYDNSPIANVQVGCWSDKWDIANAKWYNVSLYGDYGTITIPLSDMGGYTDCWYHCNIYASDSFGNQCEATHVEVFIDGKAPEIKYANITNATTSSYEVRFNVYDDSEITNVQVGCWSDKWDIENAKWYDVPLYGDYGAITIPLSDMGGYTNCWYYCNIYAWDAFGNQCAATSVKVFITDHVHQLTKVVAKPATCTGNGNIAYWTCGICNKLYSDEACEHETTKEETVIQALGHNYKIVEGSAVAATCTTDGKEVNRKCSRCNDVIEGAVIKATGHDWSEWTVIKEASYDEEGQREKVCNICGDKITGTIPKLIPTEGWATISGKTYYYENGTVKTGWLKDNGKWYYLNPNNVGVMQTGWQKISGKWYYFNSSGVMQVGWQKISGKWYYFNSSGVMQTGWQKISNKWYYFNSSGVMQTGWQKISNKWYYFSTDGIMRTGWQKISKKWYYFNSSGAMVTGTQKIDGKTYHFNSSGVWID